MTYCTLKVKLAGANMTSAACCVQPDPLGDTGLHANLMLSEGSRPPGNPSPAGPAGSSRLVPGCAQL